MTRLLLLLIASALMLFGSDSSRLYSFYQNGQYLQACNEGVKKLGKHRSDEKYISLYAFSCLQADKIDRLALPIIMLKHSKEARKNAAFFSTIFLQKNLLISALETGQSLKSLNLPTTGYILSTIFDLFSKGDYTLQHNAYLFTDPKNPRQTYKMYHNDSGLFIEEYYDTIMTKQHHYR